MRTAIGALIIKAKQLLLVRKKDIWILPGGKLKDGETDLECLIREIKEELSGTQICNARQYMEVKGTSPHKGDAVKAVAYFVDLKGELYSPSAEICESKFFGDTNGYKISNITSIILEYLIYDGYLK